MPNTALHIWTIIFSKDAYIISNMYCLFIWKSPNTCAWIWPSKMVVEMGSYWSTQYKYKVVSNTSVTLSHQWDGNSLISGKCRPQRVNRVCLWLLKQYCGWFQYVTVYSVDVIPKCSPFLPSYPHILSPFGGTQTTKCDYSESVGWTFDGYNNMFGFSKLQWIVLE